VQLSKANDIGTVQQLVEELSGVLELAGSLRPVTSLADKDKIISDTCHWYTFGQTRAAFERLDFPLFFVIDALPITAPRHKQRAQF